MLILTLSSCPTNEELTFHPSGSSSKINVQTINHIIKLIILLFDNYNLFNYIDIMIM